MAAGQITINGKTYTKREQTIPFEQLVNVNLGVFTPTFTFPGTAIFLLRGLTRTVVVAGAPVTTRPFRFKMINSDGDIQYSSMPVNGTTDRVLDSLIFGTGQFPVVLDPFIVFSPSGTLKMEIEDVSNNQPYTIFFGFRGCWLLPTS
jgi:hypothetical protein